MNNFVKSFGQTDDLIGGVEFDTISERSNKQYKKNYYQQGNNNNINDNGGGGGGGEGEGGNSRLDDQKVYNKNLKN